MQKKGQFTFNTEMVDTVQGGKSIMRGVTIVTELGQLEGTMIFLPKQLENNKKDGLDEKTGEVVSGSHWTGISRDGKGIWVGDTLVRVSLWTPNHRQEKKGVVDAIFGEEEA